MPRKKRRRHGPSCAYCFKRGPGLKLFWDTKLKAFDRAHAACLPDTSARERAVKALIGPVLEPELRGIEGAWSI